jgi:MoaD family protein
MITVRIKSFGVLNDIVDGNEIRIDENSTILDLINLINKKSDSDLIGVLIQDNRLRNNVHIFLNGENIMFNQGLKTTLKEGDNIVILRADLCGG